MLRCFWRKREKCHYLQNSAGPAHRQPYHLARICVKMKRNSNGPPPAVQAGVVFVWRCPAVPALFSRPRPQQRVLLAAMTALGYPLALYLMQGLVSLLLSLCLPGASFGNPVGLPLNASLLLGILISGAALLLPALLAARAGSLTAAEAGLAPPPAGAVRFWVPVFLGAAVLAGMLGGMLSDAVDAPPPDISLPSGGLALVLAFVSLCVLPALGEEYLFRGVIRGLLYPLGSRGAVWGAAIFFALLHGSVSQCVTALLCGFVLGACAEATGSIVPCIWMHFANNLMAFCGMYLNQYGSGQSIHLILNVLFPVWALVNLCHFRPRWNRRPAQPGLSLLRSPAFLVSAAGLAVLCLVRSGML